MVRRGRKLSCIKTQICVSTEATKNYEAKTIKDIPISLARSAASSTLLASYSFFSNGLISYFSATLQPYFGIKLPTQGNSFD
jgi:anaerobic glycerol-3-phosphate dehydrogenase